MRKILLIGITLLISLTAIGQSHLKRGAKIGNSGNEITIDSIIDENGMVTFYVDGARDGVYNDSIEILQAALTLANSKIAALEGADVTAPYPDSAYILPSNDSAIYVVFGESFAENVTYTIDNAFSFTYGTETGTVDSASAGGAVAIIYCGTNIPADSVVYIAYTKPATGGLRDDARNYVADFDTFLVFNGVASSLYIADAYYKFNGDLTDEYGVYNGTPINTIEYTGDTALIFSGSDGNDAVLVSNMLGGDFSIAYWVYADEGDQNEDYMIFANTYSAGGAGFYHYLNGNGAGKFALQATVRDSEGVNTFAFDDGYSMFDDTWNHVVATFDVDGNGTHAYAGFYLNGTKVNDNDSILADFSDFTITGDLYIGAEKAPSATKGLREGAILGELAVFDYILTQDNIDSLYAIGGDRLWYSTSTQAPTGYTDTRTIYESIDFTGELPEVFSLANKVTHLATIESWFSGDVRSVIDNTYNLGGVADFLGDTCFFTIIPAVEVAGSQILADMPGDYEEVWFGYNFWVPTNWSSPNVSGKFPGVGGYPGTGDGSNLPDGCMFPPGCDPTAFDPPDNTHDVYAIDWGFTAKTLVIKDAVFPDGCCGGFGGYVYHHGLDWYGNESCIVNKFTCGENMYITPAWPEGTWNNITFRYVMNTVTTPGAGDANGIIEIYKNGICKFVATDIIYRNYSDIYVDVYMWSIFLGGSRDLARNWATTTYFDDFELWMPDIGSNLRGAPHALEFDITSFITTK